MDFDEVLNLEEQFYNEGFAYGQDQSALASFREGKEYGLQTGFQKFLLIGQIRGLISVLSNQSSLSTQAENNINTIKELLDHIKVDNEYGNVIETEKLITKIRNKLRVLTNLVPVEKKEFNLNTIDDLSRMIGGLADEGKKQVSIGNLNDDGMW